ncbi:MAG TPA: holo-ACP synthase [Candidatus Saccharimonadales bacterium]|nr:holo-ACP synthase [Candidatus Saccharimonadales bacterium]
MGRLGVGVDLVEIPRIAAALERHGEHFVHKVFTEGEAAYCRTKRSAASWAARFAAKEALGKALGHDGPPPRWTDVEVMLDGRGRPRLRLTGRAAELAGAARIEVTLSHTHHYAVAMVVLTEP